ncbi:hypothetical protein LJK87_12260 [Paenibacillus sp. P25]|nr:hypothetical protein LJK87_12260 [Paenibacillus sp. P25]
MNSTKKRAARKLPFLQLKKYVYFNPNEGIKRNIFFVATPRFLDYPAQRLIRTVAPDNRIAIPYQGFLMQIGIFTSHTENKKIPPPRTMSWGRDFVVVSPQFANLSSDQPYRVRHDNACLYSSFVTGAPVTPSPEPAQVPL